MATDVVTKPNPGGLYAYNGLSLAHMPQLDFFNNQQVLVQREEYQLEPNSLVNNIAAKFTGRFRSRTYYST